MTMKIDGSFGEGGGQVVRSSLALSVLTGTPFELENLRAGRRKPGLLRQHLTALRAAAAISGAEVEGAELGSQRIRFEPHGLEPGAYSFAIGSAGSANLVLQTVLPPLLQASGPSTLVLEGGTHNPKAPSFDFLTKSFLPLLAQCGPQVRLELDRYGFYPAGGGQLTAHIQPGPLTGFELTETLPIELAAVALVSNLAGSIAKRELEVLGHQLQIPPERLRVLEVPSRGPGNVVWVEAKSALFTACFTTLGEKGRSAERVATELAREVQGWQASGAPVCEHLADQLLIPLAMAGGGSFRTVAPSLHTLTNMAIVERFLPVVFSSREDQGNWVIEVRPRG